MITAQTEFEGGSISAVLLDVRGVRIRLTPREARGLITTLAVAVMPLNEEVERLVAKRVLDDLFATGRRGR
jgi:hypothetical protein